MKDRPKKKRSKGADFQRQRAARVAQRYGIPKADAHLRSILKGG